MRVDLSTFNNAGYRPGGVFRRALWLVVSAVFFEPSIPVLPYAGKRWLLRAFGASVGEGVVIKPRVRIKYPWFLKVGEATWIGEGAWLDNLATMVFGCNVCVSQDAYLCTGNHNYRSPSFDLMIAPIVIEDGAWIGARAVVCPGVTVKSHAVVTVGSVVAKDVEAFAIVRGNPAVFVRIRRLEVATRQPEAV